MDLLKDAAKNLNLYEVKAYVRKAQNVAMNLTEIESKVREATNNEPWGASSSLMAQIASCTYNYREREEVVAFIFRRFTEKAANEWRQIYKSLQLLDYLIKNGSERIIDDVRANLSLIQMLKSFHYIDSKGRDQGINVRNKSKNLINLLNDDNLIRTERKKARANQKKFGGVSSAAFGGASSITGGGSSRSGGVSSFTDDDEFANRVYGDGGVYGERYDDSASAYNNGATGNDQFEEYDVQSNNHTSKPTTRASKVSAGKSSSASPSKSKPQPKEPQDDLLGDLLSFDTENAGLSNIAANANDEDDDDDFDDFQAAPSQPQKQGNINNLNNLYHPQQQKQQQQQQPAFEQQNLFSSFPTSQGTNISSQSSGPSKPTSKNDAFSSLFSSAKTKTKTTAASPSQKQSVSTPSTTKDTRNTTVSNEDDDFFGDFSSNSQTKPSNNGNASSSNNGEVDLLSF